MKLPFFCGKHFDEWRVSFKLMRFQSNKYNVFL